MDNSIIKTEEYEALVGEAKAILSETKFSAEMTIVEGRHKLGERLIKDSIYKKYAKESGRFIKKLAEDIGISERTLYNCVAFYEKFPKVETAIQTINPENKVLTWRAVVAALPEIESKRPCEHKDTFEVSFNQCRTCGYRISKEKQM